MPDPYQPGPYLSDTIYQPPLQPPLPGGQLMNPYYRKPPFPATYTTAATGATPPMPTPAAQALAVNPLPQLPSPAVQVPTAAGPPPLPTSTQGPGPAATTPPMPPGPDTPAGAFEALYQQFLKANQNVNVPITHDMWTGAPHVTNLYKGSQKSGEYLDPNDPENQAYMDKMIQGVRSQNALMAAMQAMPEAAKYAALGQEAKFEPERLANALKVAQIQAGEQGDRGLDQLKQTAYGQAYGSWLQEHPSDFAGANLQGQAAIKDFPSSQVWKQTGQFPGALPPPSSVPITSTPSPLPGQAVVTPPMSGPTSLLPRIAPGPVAEALKPVYGEGGKVNTEKLLKALQDPKLQDPASLQEATRQLLEKTGGYDALAEQLGPELEQRLYTMPGQSALEHTLGGVNFKPSENPGFLSSGLTMTVDGKKTELHPPLRNVLGSLWDRVMYNPSQRPQLERESKTLADIIRQMQTLSVPAR